MRLKFMTCKQVEALIPDFICGDLEGDELDIVRIHIEECSDCAKAAELFKSTIFLIKESAYTPPEEIEINVKNRITEYNKRQKIVRLAMRYTAVAAVAAIILSVTLSRLPKMGMKSTMPESSKDYQAAAEMYSEDIDMASGKSDDSVIPEANQIAPRAAMMAPAQQAAPEEETPTAEAEPELAAEEAPAAEAALVPKAAPAPEEEAFGIMTYGLNMSQESADEAVEEDFSDVPVVEYFVPQDEGSYESYYYSGDIQPCALYAMPTPVLVRPNADGAEYLIKNYSPGFEGKIFAIYTTGNELQEDPVLTRKFNKIENEGFNLYFAKNTIDVLETVGRASGGSYPLSGAESAVKADGNMYIIILEFFKYK